jgi:NAD(P)-dependent dehydrogenase (short-subunit alcohol dehydrogenase family)
MTITFITGANKGLGFVTAQRLIGLGQTVLIGARDPERGAAAAAELGATFVQIDVTDADSVRAAAARIEAEHGVLDVLINNAGIIGPHLPVPQLDRAAALAAFDTNVFGVLTVTNAFLPLLERSDNPRIVNVTSGVGSFALRTTEGTDEFGVPPVIYGVTKSALTMLTLQYASALPAMRVNAADPGYTATEFNGFSGHQTPEEGTDAIVQLATLPADGPTGTFINRRGPSPW